MSDDVGDSSSLIVGLVGMLVFFFFQAEDGIRDLVRSRGLGDVYKRQSLARSARRRAGVRLYQNHSWR